MVVKVIVPLLGPYYNTAPITWGTHKGTLILTATNSKPQSLNNAFKSPGEMGKGPLPKVKNLKEP